FSEPIQVHKSQHWSALDGTWVQIFPEDERKAWRLYFDQGIYSLHLSNLSKQREVLIPDVKVDCYPHRKCRIWASQRYQFTVQYSEEKVKIIRPLVYDSSLAMKANELYRRKPDR
ncbi:MAG: hypothetical protein KDK33_13740, partial [Leptospiraceae bacterium]|nr:hypothetical protein [Leptospiraceae bacterium]